MKNPPPFVVEVRTKPLPGNPVYTLYQLYVYGRLVREQISAFSDADILAGRV